MGRKKLPIYKIVAADARSPRDGRFIEDVGYYNPNAEPMEVKLKETRVFYWLKNGAQPTDTVKSLLQREGILLRLNLKKRKFTEDQITEEIQKFHDNKGAKDARAKEKKLRRKQTKATKKAEAKQEGEKKPEA